MHTRSIVVAFVVVLLQLTALAVAAPLPILLCVTVQTSYLSSPLHSRFAVQYYGAQFKNTVYSTRVIGQWEGGASSARGIASAYAVNSTGCDVFIGPATSTFAIALNALVGGMWMSYTATSTQLSDRLNYPLFSRTIPTDAKNVRGLVTMMVKFGWLQANALCADTSNGQSLVQGVKDLYGPQGGTLLSSDCMNPTSSLADVRVRIQKFLSSSTRAIFVAVAASDPVFQSFLTALAEPGVAGNVAVFFCSAVCSTASAAWKSVPGAICATFAFDNQPYLDFRAAYMQRDMTADIQSFADMNWPLGATDLTFADSYVPFAIDATRLAMYSMDAYVGLYGKKPSPAATAVAWLRNQSLRDGVTGVVTLPTGDRDACDVGIFSTGPGNTSYRLGNLTAAGNLTTLPQVYLFGQWWDINNVPSATVVPPAAAADQPYWVIAVVLVPLLTIAAAAAYHIRSKQALASRPLDATKPYAVMFVGVKNMSELSDLGDGVASSVCTKLASIIRQAVRSNKCFEARRIDESTVMITAKRSQDALACAADISEAVNMKHRWDAVATVPVGSDAGRSHQRQSTDASLSTSLRQGGGAPDARLNRHQADRHSVRSSVNDGSTVTRRKKSTQPQLQMGIHFGFGNIDYDEENNTVSYHGAAVQRAAAVTDAAAGNQILVTRELVSALEESGDTDEAISDVGRFRKTALENGADSVMFVPLWMTEAFVAAVEHAISKGSATLGDRESGAISAALQHAEAGLSLRRVAVVAIEIPWLDDANDAKDISRIAQLCEELESIARQHRGEVYSYGDGELVFTLNAKTATSMPVVRATSIAVECVQHCTLQHLAASAGVAMSTCVVGHQQGRITAFGSAVRTAKAAQQLAKASGVPVALAETGYEDVASRFHVMTMGVMVLRSGKLGRVVAITDARDTHVEGEWLYTVGSVSAGLSANERAWEAVVQGAVPSTELLKDLDEHHDSEAAGWQSAHFNGARERLHKLLNNCVEDGSTITPSAVSRLLNPDPIKAFW